MNSSLKFVGRNVHIKPSRFLIATLLLVAPWLATGATPEDVPGHPAKVVEKVKPEVADHAAKTPFKIPFSLQVKIISPLEADGLANFGAVGLTEYVVKQIPGMATKKYKTFDNSIVVTFNSPKMSEQMLHHIRLLVADELSKQGLKLVDPAHASAGIASILSPFEAKSGKTTWELLLVVFDRKKMGVFMKAHPDATGLAPVFQAAIRGMVVHRFPETNLDLQSSVINETTRDALKIMFDKGFSHFMEPLVIEKVKGKRQKAKE